MSGKNAGAAPSRAVAPRLGRMDTAGGRAAAGGEGRLSDCDPPNALAGRRAPLCVMVSVMGPPRRHLFTPRGGAAWQHGEAPNQTPSDNENCFRGSGPRAARPGSAYMYMYRIRPPG